MNLKEYLDMSLSEREAQHIENVYNSILESMKELSGRTYTKVVSQAIDDLIDFLIEKLSSEGHSLLLCTGKIFGKNYIFVHSLDVCLIPIRIGIRLRFEKERLKDLGFFALTHAEKDIGFPEKPLKNIIHDKEMDEIIRLADVYDALSHPPAYRHSMLPRETLETIIKSDRFFDRRLIKVLLDELSFYPKGSWVQLSSNEMGKVIKVNKGLLLRPIVEVFMDWEGNYLEKKKIVDLAKNYSIYVLRPLTEEDIKHITRKE